MAVCSFTIAVNRKFSKQGEEKQADFIPIVAWDKTAEFCGKYFTKGLQVAVVGRIQTRTWDDNEGKRHYVTEIVAEEAHFADSKKGEGSPSKASFGKGDNSGDGFYPIPEDDELPF
jgi:single-strand DNA-binding protein